MSKRYGSKPIRHASHGIGEREQYWDRYKQTVQWPSYGRTPDQSELSRRARRHLAKNLARGSRARNRPDNVGDRIMTNRRERTDWS